MGTTSPKSPIRRAAPGAVVNGSHGGLQASGTPIRVLILEDSRSDAALMVDALGRAGFDPKWERVEDERAFAARLAPDLDLILSDYDLPTFSGLQAIRLVRSRGLDIPFILVSSSIGEDYAVEAMRAGADDYLLKDRMARLGPAIHQAVERRRLRTQEERAEAALGASEMIYRGIFEGAAEGILLSTLDGYLLAANPAAAQILGYDSPEELASSLTNPGRRLYADPDARRTLVERVKRDGEVHGYETCGLRKDGTPLWVSLSARLVDSERSGTSRILTMIADISERKRADEVRANLAAIVEGSNDAIIGRSLDGVITSWNAGAERMLGYSASEVIGRSVAFLIPPGQRVRSAEMSEKILRGEAIAPHETKRQTKDGRVIDVLSSISPLRDAQGKVVGASHILHEITLLKRVEQARARLAAIVEQSNDAIISRALDRTILTWNPAAERLFGWTAHEAIGQSILLVVPPERIGENAERRKQVEQGLTVPSYDTVRLTKDGRHIDVSLSQSPIKNEHGEVTAVSLILRDVTERVLSSRHRALEHAVTRVLAESVAMDEAMPKLISTMCEAMDWAYGARWSWDERKQILRRAEFWSDFEPAFDTSDRQYWLELGQGGPGGLLRRAWLAKESAWLANIENDTHFRRKPSCTKFGLRSAYSFPILAGNSVISVMEFFGREARQPDQMMLQITEAIGRQIGQFIQRKEAEEARHMSEATLRATFEQAGVGMGLRSLDPRNPRWLRVNQKLCDIFGYSQEELLRLTTVDLTPPEERGLAIDYNEKLRKGEIAGYSREKRYVRKDGSTLWANISLAALRGPDGRPTHVISVIEDITARKDADDKIKRLSRVRTVSSEINAAIVRSRNKQMLFYEACRIAIEHGGFGIAWVGTYDPKKMEVTPLASAGLGESTSLMHEKLVVRGDTIQARGIIARAIRERRPVFDNDITADPAAGGMRRQEAIRRGYRSVIALPLVVDRMVAGIFSMFAKEAGFFDREEVSLLSELAGNISIALERMASQEKIGKLSSIRAVSSEINAAIVRIRERDALLAETCRIASEHGGIEMTWVGTIDSEKQEVRPVAWRGFSAESAHAVSWASISAAKGALGEAMHTRKAAVRDDIETQLPAGKLRQEALAKGCHSTVCLPLVVEGRVAALAALFAPGRGSFDGDELALLNELAGNISFALEHISRQERIEKLSRIRAVSSEINAAIASVREREALLRETCRVASEHGTFEFVWVASVDPERQQIQPVAWTGFAPGIAQSVNWASIGVPGVTLGEVIRTQRLAVRNDFDAEQPTGILRQEAAKKGCRSTVCLPFLVDEKVAAAMILFATGRNFFVEDELALLGEVASNISFALESIARQEKLDRLTRIRTVLGEINVAIVRIRNRQELFEEACRITVEHGKFGMAWISELDPLTLDVTPVAYAGIAAGDFVTSKTTARADVPLGQGVVGRAIRAKDLVFVNDITAEAGVGSAKRREAIRLGYRSVIALPLILENAVTGTLTLYAKEPGFFNEEEIKLLRELTGDISFALENITREEKLNYLAYYDTLTALPNRTLFIDRASQQMRARTGEAPIVAMILINLERFRNINESFGRHGGDRLLKLVAERLETAFHGKDYLARTGADGFGVVIRGIRDAESVVHVLGDQVLGCFREPYRLSGSEVRVAAKAGIAMFPADGGDADTLFKNAEAALKKARDTGERYLFYATDMNARAAHVLSLETRLRNAVEKQQFVLHYQPKFNLISDTVCGLEALIRWNDPESGLVAPGMFIPLLEETGLILEVGRWAIAQALIDHREWAASGCTVPRIAVNVSAIQLQQRDFTETVINAVQQADGSAEALEIEITESLLMKDIETSIRKLSILRGLGVHIAMDDFGTGYSSLSYIARLPINLIKIDRAFINGIAMNPQDMSIVTTIIALAHSLNLRVVAEGVETREQSQLLKLLKCDEAQGYLFSKPVPPGQIEPVLRAKARVAP